MYIKNGVVIIPCYKSTADEFSGSGTHGDVLEVGILGSQTPGSRDHLLECGMNAAVHRRDVAGQGVVQQVHAEVRTLTEGARRAQKNDPHEEVHRELFGCGKGKACTKIIRIINKTVQGFQNRLLKIKIIIRKESKCYIYMHYSTVFRITFSYSLSISYLKSYPELFRKSFTFCKNDFPCSSGSYFKHKHIM